jgi:GMP synthase-like glutamine amidotransferase
MAKALGERVYPISRSGNRLERYRNDPRSWRGLPNKFSVLQWHDETFDLPRGAVLLASSARCRNQAFRFGANAWGFQFHIETTEDMLHRWLAEPDMCGDLKYAAEPAVQLMDPARTRGEQARIVLSRWASLARNRSTGVV